ncbi:MAG: tetratricopeptide repeat protein, partial [Candidatus Omnitrophica bacterium]|nr:tetratricopeptide repeat protein [Candidatus Omnitrophota bacterium]
MRRFLFVLILISLGLNFSFSQDPILSKKLSSAKKEQDFYSLLEDFKDLYFKENRYEDFLKELKKLTPKIPSGIYAYYISLCRYRQLKFFEGNQDWDNYFKNLSGFKEEIENHLKESIRSSGFEPFGILSRLLLFKFYLEHNNPEANKILEELINLILENRDKIKDFSLIKRVAQELENLEEKSKAKKLYNLYVENLARTQTDLERIKAEGFSFYQAGSLELSKEIFKLYIGKITSTFSDKEKLKEELFSLVKLFIYKKKEPCDATFAEEIFKHIENIFKEEVFDEEMLYLRGFNLEKQKEFISAKDIYLKLIERYPQTKYFDELVYKVGLITAYILRDKEKAKLYFKELSQKERLSPQIVSSIYQLGLLNHWEGNYAEAKGFYQRIIDMAKEEFFETTELAKKRLKEIEEQKPIEYNLRTFLDVVFKQEYQYLDRTKIELIANPYVCLLYTS